MLNILTFFAKEQWCGDAIDGFCCRTWMQGSLMIVTGLVLVGANVPIYLLTLCRDKSKFYYEIKIKFRIENNHKTKQLKECVSTTAQNAYIPRHFQFYFHPFPPQCWKVRSIYNQQLWWRSIYHIWHSCGPGRIWPDRNKWQRSPSKAPPLARHREAWLLMGEAAGEEVVESWNLAFSSRCPVQMTW